MNPSPNPIATLASCASLTWNHWLISSFVGVLTLKLARLGAELRCFERTTSWTLLCITLYCIVMNIVSAWVWHNYVQFAHMHSVRVQHICNMSARCARSVCVLYMCKMHALILRSFCAHNVAIAVVRNLHTFCACSHLALILRMCPIFCLLHILFTYAICA